MLSGSPGLQSTYKCQYRFTTQRDCCVLPVYPRKRSLLVWKMVFVSKTVPWKIVVGSVRRPLFFKGTLSKEPSQIETVRGLLLNPLAVRLKLFDASSSAKVCRPQQPWKFPIVHASTIQHGVRWWFPEIGVPLNHPFKSSILDHFSRIFHYTPTSYGGTPMAMETPKCRELRSLTFALRFFSFQLSHATSAASGWEWAKLGNPETRRRHK